MKLLSRKSFGLLIAVTGISLLLCCKKSSFQDGVGLYGQKQYHHYSISAPGDTLQLANSIISIVDQNNNYLTWNNISFYLNSTNNDSLVTYINDTSINGNYEVLYDLNYYPKTDQVVVIGYAIFGGGVDAIWKSY